MISKKSIQLHNFLLLSNFYQPLLLSKQTFEKRFLFLTHSLFQKMDKHENENYDQCDPDSNSIPRHHSYIRTTYKNESGSNERGMRRNRQRCTTVFLDPLMRPYVLVRMLPDAFSRIDERVKHCQLPVHTVSYSSSSSRVIVHPDPSSSYRGHSFLVDRPWRIFESFRTGGGEVILVHSLHPPDLHRTDARTPSCTVIIPFCSTVSAYTPVSGLLASSGKVNGNRERRFLLSRCCFERWIDDFWWLERR